MSDDLKTQEQSVKPESAQGQATKPPMPTPEVQADPAGQTPTSAQQHRTEKRHPLVRLGRMIRKHRREGPKWTDISIVLLTAGIVFLAYMQHRDMTEAGVQTDKIIAADERLAKGMEDSVGQAKRGLDASIELSHKDQRAWVGPTGVTWIMRPNEESKWTVVVANTGKSPAMHVHIDQTAKTVLKAIPKDFIYGPLDEGSMHSDSLLQPGMPLILNSTKNPTPSQTQIDMVRSGALVAYIFGKIRYNDIFGSEHHTTFCLQMGRDLQTVASCKEYNNAD